MNRKYNTTKEQMQEAVTKSLSISQVCKELGIRAAGSNYKTVKSKIESWEIDISHFTGQGWNIGDRFRKFSFTHKTEDILVENSPYTNSNSLRKRLIKERLLENRCYICDIERWNGKEITLELDHINGNNRDNKIENLRLLCPNCHSQTDNFRGRNIQGRHLAG